MPAPRTELALFPATSWTNSACGSLAGPGVPVNAPAARDFEQEEPAADFAASCGTCSHHPGPVLDFALAPEVRAALADETSLVHHESCRSGSLHLVADAEPLRLADAAVPPPAAPLAAAADAHRDEAHPSVLPVVPDPQAEMEAVADALPDAPHPEDSEAEAAHWAAQYEYSSPARGRKAVEEEPVSESLLPGD
jgi:hypothetical protein